MKRNVARIAFWVLCYITLFFIFSMIGAIFTTSSDVDMASGIIIITLLFILLSGDFFLYRCYDPFRERYYLTQDTPLKFHIIFCYIILPLGGVYIIKVIYDLLVAEYFLSNFIYGLAWIDAFKSLVLICICFVGLRKFKSYAWYALMANYLTGVFFSTVMAVVDCIFYPMLLTIALVILMDQVYIAAIICLYYYKRKALFFTPNLISETNDKIAYFGKESHIVEEKTIPANDEMLEISFCRKCGYKLEKNSHFCSQCGTAVIFEEE